MVNNSLNHVIPCWETEERYEVLGKVYFYIGWAKDEGITSYSYLSGDIEHE